MEEGKFIDFVIALEKSGADFRAHVESDQGQEDSNFTLPFTQEELDQLYSQFGRIPAPQLGGSTLSASDFGKRLFDAVFSPKISSLYSRNRGVARERQSGVRVVLRLSNDPALQDLPWELLADEQNFLALSAETPLVRYLELPMPPPTERVQLPLRVLVVIANPQEYPQLDVENEWLKLHTALNEVIEEGLVELVRLPRADMDTLFEYVNQSNYHILHFIGHGVFDETRAKPSLILEKQDGSSQRVDAEVLAVALQDRRALRLVVLNACETGRALPRDAFAGIAQALIKKQVSSVIAMQFPVSDQAAQKFTQNLYGGIARGKPIDAALSQARQALFVNRFSYEWATPVYYTRARDGKLFDLGELNDSERFVLKLRSLLRRAKEAIEENDFARAEQAIQKALALDRNEPNVLAVQRQLETRREMVEMYRAGKNLFDQGQWLQALDRLMRVKRIDPTYGETLTMIEMARTRLAALSNANSEMLDWFEDHYEEVAQGMLDGEVVLFLGGGVNRVGYGESSLGSRRGMRCRMGVS